MSRTTLNNNNNKNLQDLYEERNKILLKNIKELEYGEKRREEFYFT